MKFVLIPPRALALKLNNVVYLERDGWNDFSYQTLFHMYYRNNSSKLIHIGSVKIGFENQTTVDWTLSEVEDFSELDRTHFSLGQSPEYYNRLKELGNEIRVEILQSLNDLAFNIDRFQKLKNEDVISVSLLRFITVSEVTGQFSRIAHGGVFLTPFDFIYIHPSTDKNLLDTAFEFKVIPNSLPPSNIHVLIGRNGVGKTFIINNMISSIINENSHEKNEGYFEFAETAPSSVKFPNIISVSFSAFDEAEPKNENHDIENGIRYTYIGLKKRSIKDRSKYVNKTPIQLKNEFIKSLKYCIESTNVNRWVESIEMLESDPMFKESQIKEIAYMEKNYFETDVKDDKEKQEPKYIKNAKVIFNKLSSGHKIILLTITRLVESLEEKSLVLIDEPETHLHPPLLSAFIRSLSKLLISTNGVAVIATHSPVVLQEVPQSCVLRMSRSGNVVKAERIAAECFGESVGILTKEVFGLEVMNSGYYDLIKKEISEVSEYKKVIETFDENVGSEARALIRTIIEERKKNRK